MRKLILVILSVVAFTPSAFAFDYLCKELGEDGKTVRNGVKVTISFEKQRGSEESKITLDMDNVWKRGDKRGTSEPCEASHRINKAHLHCLDKKDSGVHYTINLDRDLLENRADGGDIEFQYDMDLSKRGDDALGFKYDLSCWKK